MDIYEPKIILDERQLPDFELLMARELAMYIQSDDPPSPFRGPLESTDEVKMVINNTNDLKFQVEHWISEIKNGANDVVLIGDPFRHGYSMQIINNIAELCDIPCNYIVAKDWIIFCLNIADLSKLRIKDSKLIQSI